MHTIATRTANEDLLVFPTLTSIEDQKVWETAGVSEGVKRYRRTQVSANFADTAPGQRATHEIMKRLVPAIIIAQEEALTGLTSLEKGKKTKWWWMMIHLPADVLSLITIRTIMTSSSRDSIIGREMTPLILRIGENVRLEMEYIRWREDEKRATKEDPTRLDTYKLLRARVGSEPTARRWQTWRKKVESVRQLKWTRAEKFHLGAKLLHLAVTNSGGWYEIRDIYRRGKTSRRVIVTEAAQSAMADINANMEINRPFLLPMTCPPQPWIKEQPI